MKRIVTVKFSLDLLKRLDDLARRLGTDRSKIIRMAVEERLNGKRIRCPRCNQIIDLDEYYSKHYPAQDDP